MKAMFISDLLIAKKYLIQQAILGVLVGAFISVMTGTLYVALPAIGVMIPFSLAFTIIAFDERDGWQQFRLSLPISRTGIILGRYASLGVVALGGLAVGLATTGIMAAAAALAPGIPQLSALSTDFAGEALTLTSALSLAIILLMFAVILPLASRFGMTKAIRIIPVVIVFIVVIVFGFGDMDAMPAVLSQLITWITTPEGMLAATGIIIVAAIAVYALSGALSIRLYRTREF